MVRVLVFLMMIGLILVGSAYFLAGVAVPQDILGLTLAFFAGLLTMALSAVGMFWVVLTRSVRRAGGQA